MKLRIRPKCGDEHGNYKERGPGPNSAKMGRWVINTGSTTIM